MKLGVDLGGTKIEAIVLDENQAVLWRQRAATPKQSYVAVLGAIQNLVSQAKHECGLPDDLPVGIGTPGAIARSSVSGELLMKNCNSVVLNGQPLLSDLKRVLACSVRLANDANCFALAETRSGCGASMFGERIPECCFGVILGTGVGGGIVVRGELLEGLHTIGGEWGHNCLPATALQELPKKERDRACYCGRFDCVETYLSGPGLALSYQLRFDEVLSSETIILRMRAGDARASEIWQDYLEQLAASLAQVINIIDPQLIVLGGGMSTIDEIYPSLSRRLAPHVFTEGFATPIKPALLGDSAGVFGAAWL